MVTVYRPHVLLEETAEAADDRAPRRVPSEGMVLGLIDNNKPRAGVMLQFVAEALRAQLPIADVLVFKKPTAGEPIEATEAASMARKADLVIAGVGD